MAYIKPIMQKLKRNLDMLGIANTTDGVSVTVGNLVVSYELANIAAPMGGIDNTISPFLGAGVQTPGYLLIKDANAGHDTLPEVIVTETDLQVFSMVCRFGNSVKVYGRNAGNTADVLLATVVSNVDVLGVGQ